MQMNHLERLKAWFETYSKSFLTNDAAEDGPLVLKIEHTARVCENTRRLARSIDLGNSDRHVAEAVGLLHDIGRFVQFSRYGTFNDRQSVNHATLGIDVLRQEAVLDGLNDVERSIIMDAVRFHNAPALPTDRPSTSMVFMRLIRDADKLDIWKVFADYYRRGQLPEPAIIQHLPDVPTWREAVIDAVLQGSKADYHDMRSLNDYKLLQISWVFELYFRETIVLAKKRGDVAVIARSLPSDPILDRAAAAVMKRLEEINQPGCMQAATGQSHISLD
jgi:putative nucleotidyltransferase with HDIG domain